jgi:hypothetical protein
MKLKTVNPSTGQALCQQQRPRGAGRRVDWPNEALTMDRSRSDEARAFMAAGLAALLLACAVAAPAVADDRPRYERGDDRGRDHHHQGQDRRVVVPPGHRVRMLPPRCTPVVVHRRHY